MLNLSVMVIKMGFLFVNSSHPLYSYVLATLLSGIKFVFGLLTGLANGFEWWQTALCTFSGMMLSVVILSFVGEKARAYWKKRQKPKPLFTKSNRRIVSIWKKYGLYGVAFLTPLLFTPIGGTLIAVSFGEHKAKIIVYMAISAAFWAIIVSQFGEAIMSLKHYLHF